jgi:hypothetical protein
VKLFNNPFGVTRTSSIQANGSNGHADTKYFIEYIHMWFNLWNFNYKISENYIPYDSPCIICDLNGRNV